jgi:hypothetical protein
MRSSGTVVAVSLALVLSSSPASARDSFGSGSSDPGFGSGYGSSSGFDAPAPRLPRRGSGWYLGSLKTDRDAGFLHMDVLSTSTGVPAMAVNGDDAPRRLVGLPSPGRSAQLYGGSATLELRTNVVIVRLFEFRYAAGGGSVLGTGYANGAPVTVERGAVHQLQIGLPAFGLPTGVQGTSGGWKARFDFLDWGISHVWASTRLTEANGAMADTSASVWGGYYRISLAGCREIGRWAEPLRAWGCLYAAPSIYDSTAGGWLSAVTFGARAEL